MIIAAQKTYKVAQFLHLHCLKSLNLQHCWPTCFNAWALQQLMTEKYFSRLEQTLKLKKGWHYKTIVLCLDSAAVCQLKAIFQLSKLGSLDP